MWLIQGLPIDIFYLDFQKACGMVPHRRLLLKLKVHGIGGGVLDWIEDWLKGRMERCVKWSSVRLELLDRCLEWNTPGFSTGPSLVCNIYQ